MSYGGPDYSDKVACELNFGSNLSTLLMECLQLV